MAGLYRMKFRAWLAAKAPDEIVGDGGDCHGCPLANFLREMSGGVVEAVIGTGRTGEMTIDRGGGERPLPWWAERFVFKVDGHDAPNITAGTAIELFDQI